MSSTPVSRPASLGSRIAASDQAILRRIADTDWPVLDSVLPRLSVAANHSVLWGGVAATLFLTGQPRARRAAARGLASIALASAISNLVAKSLNDRARPQATAVPVARRLARVPTSSSFPSGHSASAAAFATGTALELPALALVIAPVAAAVGVSRVVTGVHYPSDVVAGFGIGVGCALATLLWRRAR
jgi:membrane-associated phospholipid phosphatase